MTNYRTREIALSGRLRTAEDGTTIAPNDFQELANLRYLGSHLQAVRGMSKVNGTALANPRIRSAFQYRKSGPSSEAHIIVSALDSGGTGPTIYRNGADIPSQGDFDASPLYTEAPSSSTTRFCVGPDGKLVASNGVDTLIWGGNEFPAAKVLDWDASRKTYKYDCTEQLVNSLDTDGNVATLHSHVQAVDNDTVLLLHFDNDFTDSSPVTPHTVTPQNAYVVSYGGPRFGPGVASFMTIPESYIYSYLTIPDDPDFDFSGGIWTIDAWVKLTYVGWPETVYFQRDFITGGEIRIYISSSGELCLYVRSASGATLSLSGGYINQNQWTHIAAVENNDDYYLFVNGSLVASASSAIRCPDCDSDVYIGIKNAGDFSDWLDGYMDELRVSRTARWTTSFAPPTVAYGDSHVMELYVGSTVPLDGIRFYVKEANTVAGTMEVSYWDGSAWSRCTSISDGTSVNGVPLAQTGLVTFDSTDGQARLKNVDGVLLYWYLVSVSTGNSLSAVLSRVTLRAPMQQLKDLWDGEYRSVAAFQVFRNNTYNDFTHNVYENAMDATNEATFAKIGGLSSATDYLVVGFNERISGMYLGIVGGHVNGNAAVATVSYWDGSAWQDVTSDDQTSENNASLAKSGTICWQSPPAVSEHRTRLSGKPGLINVVSLQDDTSTSWGHRAFLVTNQLQAAVPVGETTSAMLYWYKVRFSGNLTAGTGNDGVELYYIGGIPAQVDVRGYEIPLTHQGRLFLFGNRDAEPDAWIVSAPNTSQVFNGRDTLKSYFGDGLLPNAAASLTARFGFSVSPVVIVTNEQRVYAITGETLESMQVRCISEQDGCIAPMSMAVVSLPDAALPGRGRMAAVWLSRRGVVMSDGTAPVLLSEDIGDLFDPASSTFPGESALRMAYGWVDQVYGEYHLCLPYSGGEWCASLSVQRDGRVPWFQINRGSGRFLSGGFSVCSTSGVAYSCGFSNLGHLYLLEDGTTFDGEPIVCWLRTADIAPEGNFITVESFVRGVKVVQAARDQSAGSVLVEHYGDTRLTPTVVGTIVPGGTAVARIDDAEISKRLGPYIFHSLRLSVSGDPDGFRPLMIGLLYEPTRIDTRSGRSALGGGAIA